MGLGKFIIKKTAETVIENVGVPVIDRIDKVLTKLEEKEKTKPEKKKPEPLFNQQLIILEKSLSHNKFFVYDKDNNKRYKVIIHLPVLGGFSARLYGMDRQGNGRVVEIRRHFELRRSKQQYAMYLNEKRVGTITDTGSLKGHLLVDYNGWSLKGTSILQNHYEIFNSDSEKVSSIDTISPSIVIQYDDPDVEIIGLLLIMTLMIGNARITREACKGQG